MKPFFISIPHSGERVPAETPWLIGLPEPVLMCDVDRYVDRLYEPIISDLNLPYVKTQWHRYVVDLNRLPDDVDCDTVEGSQNPSGQFSTGLHWLKTTRGTRLMPKPIAHSLHQQLVRDYFEPFHADVCRVYAELKSAGAQNIFHLDCHSMPSRGTAAHRDPGQVRDDIVVSDWEGRSAKPQFKDLVIEAYQKAGFKVGYNWPYLGGRVTQTYGLPALGQHAIQVELNRSLYMDEETKQWLPDQAKALVPRLSQAVRYIHAKVGSL
jgi:N-formylglutamate deformylase